MTLFSASFAVVDLETTGIPNRPEGFEPKVIELGACIVGRDGAILDRISFFVRQPHDVLHDPRAARAFEITGITPDEVQEKGLHQPLAAKVFALWLAAHRVTSGISGLVAFNQDFDFGFLRSERWNTFGRSRVPEGECLMLAAMELMGPAGALPPAPAFAQAKGQKWKWPRVAEAVAFFNGRGYDIAWGQNAAHRALEDCLKESALAVAIAKESGLRDQQLGLPLSGAS